MIIKFEATYTTTNQLLYSHYEFAMDVTKFEAEYGKLAIWESALYHALQHLQENNGVDITELSSITLIRD